MNRINIRMDVVTSGNLDFDVLLLKGIENHVIVLKQFYVEKIKSKLFSEKNQEIKKIINNIFIDDGNNLITLINNKMKKFEWLKLMVTKFIKSLSLSRSDFQLFYNSCCHLFAIYYEKIKLNFGEFFAKLKSEIIKNNIYGCFISFLTFCNEKKNFISIAKEIYSNEKLKQYEDKYNNNMKNKLSEIIKHYCSYYEIGLYDEIDENKVKFKENLQDELDEFNCFVEVCKPGEAVFQKFYHSLYNCIGNKLRDIYLKNSKDVKEFIDILFESLMSYFKFEGFWKNENMLIMYKLINEYALRYATIEGNSNYLDFVICYKYKYDIALKDFILLLIDGLKNENLNKIFILANKLIDNFGDIDDKNNIELLIQKLSKKGKRKNIKKINSDNISSIIERNSNDEINSLNTNLKDKEQDDKINSNLGANFEIKNNIDNDINREEFNGEKNIIQSSESMTNNNNSMEIKKETKNNFENEETITKNMELFQKSNEENKFNNNIYDLSSNEEFKELKILVQKLKNADDKISEEIQNLKLLVQNLEQQDKKNQKK